MITFDPTAEPRRLKAWAEGRDAFDCCTASDIHHNPYPESQWPEHEAWAAGWHHAQRDFYPARG